MSKYLIVNAWTNSEWDSVSFAVIELSDPHIAFIKQVRDVISSLGFKAEEGFVGINYSGDNADFYLSEEELPEELQPMEEQPIVADIDDEVIKNLTRPEQEIRHGEIRFNEDGVQYVAFGKHTSEEFWVSRIPYDVIFQSVPA